MSLPTGLHAALFEPPPPPPTPCGLRAYARTLRMRARQQPGLARGDRRKLDAMASMLELGGEALRTLSADANERAFALMERSSRAKRQLMALIRDKDVERRALCVSEAYDRLLFVRQDARTRDAELYTRLNDLILFCDAQDEFRICIHAHRLAALVPELEHTLVKGCGCCVFRARL